MIGKRKRSAVVALMLAAAPITACNDTQEIKQEKQDCDWSPTSDCAPATPVVRSVLQPNSGLIYYYIYMSNLAAPDAKKPYPYFAKIYGAAPAVSSRSSYKSSYSGFSSAGSISRGGFGSSAKGSSAS